jgi:hypothetical protein
MNHSKNWMDYRRVLENCDCFEIKKLPGHFLRQSLEFALNFLSKMEALINSEFQLLNFFATISPNSF